METITIGRLEFFGDIGIIDDEPIVRPLVPRSSPPPLPPEALRGRRRLAPPLQETILGYIGACAAAFALGFGLMMMVHIRSQTDRPLQTPAAVTSPKPSAR